jgi:hypothetical protein
MFVKPVAKKWFMSDAEVRSLQAQASSGPQGGSYGIGKGGLDRQAALAWLAVGIPILWGVWITLQSAIRIFS